MMINSALCRSRSGRPARERHNIVLWELPLHVGNIAQGIIVVKKYLLKCLLKTKGSNIFHLPCGDVWWIITIICDVRI